MDLVGWFLLFLFVGAVVFIVYLYRRSENGGASYTPPSPEPDSVKKEAQKYISIYKYTSMRPVRKCACCDGENTYGAKVCCICGTDMDI